MTDSIQSFCLTMVYVSHYSYNWSTRHELYTVILFAFNYSFIIKAYKMNFTAIFCSKQSCSI